jgi:hypothetical protein
MLREMSGGVKAIKTSTIKAWACSMMGISCNDAVKTYLTC